MSNAHDFNRILRKKAKRQKWWIGIGAVLFALVVSLSANSFGLLDGWIEWPIKFLIYAAAVAIWGYSAKAIDGRVAAQSRTEPDRSEHDGAAPLT